MEHNSHLLPIPELSEDELEPFFACPALAAAFAGLAGIGVEGDLTEGFFTTFFSSSELESRQKKHIPYMLGMHPRSTLRPIGILISGSLKHRCGIQYHPLAIFPLPEFLYSWDRK